MKKEHTTRKKKKPVETIHDPNDVHDMLMENDELWKIQVESYLSIPIEMREKAQEVVRSVLKSEDVEKISKLIKASPITWSFESNLSWGAKIRNLLRKEVCSDEEFVNGSWNEAFPIIVSVALLQMTEAELEKGTD